MFGSDNIPEVRAAKGGWNSAGHIGRHLTAPADNYELGQFFLHFLPTERSGETDLQT